MCACVCTCATLFNLLLLVYRRNGIDESWANARATRYIPHYVTVRIPHYIILVHLFILYYVHCCTRVRCPIILTHCVRGDPDVIPANDLVFGLNSYPVSTLLLSRSSVPLSITSVLRDILYFHGNDNVRKRVGKKFRLRIFRESIV